MFPDFNFTDEDIKKRYAGFYGDEEAFAEGRFPYWRQKLSNLSEFVREIKFGFARYYNRSHHRRGYFWGDRFKSVIVEIGSDTAHVTSQIRESLGQRNLSLKITSGLSTYFSRNMKRNPSLSRVWRGCIR